MPGPAEPLPTARWLPPIACSAAILAAALACGSPPAVGDGQPAGCLRNPRTADLSFTLNDTHGAQVDLRRYRDRVVFLNFWATWCVPCAVEIPVLIELQQRYEGDGLSVIGVVTLDDFSNARPYAERARIPYPVLDGTSRPDVERAYRPQVLPTSFLIARDGSICSEHRGLPKPEPNESLPDALRRTLRAQIEALL
jgi:thiol-disulfide isomerase/thioredoxin